MTWNTEKCRDNAIWWLSSLLSVFFHALGALTMSWKGCLLLGQHTDEGISHKPHKRNTVHNVRFLIQRERLFFVRTCDNSWDHGFVVLFIATTKLKVPVRPWLIFVLFLSFGDNSIWELLVWTTTIFCFLCYSNFICLKQCQENMYKLWLDESWHLFSDFVIWSLSWRN